MSDEKHTMKDDFLKLAKDLYHEGYICGIPGGDTGEKWFEAWADAMVGIAKGGTYGEDTVVECFRHIDDWFDDDSDRYPPDGEYLWRQDEDGAVERVSVVNGSPRMRGRNRCISGGQWKRA